MTEATNVTSNHLTRTPDVADGKPCIAGRRIRVQDIYVWHEHNGKTADEIASEYNLNLVQVYAALTYAFDHLDEIRESIHSSESIVDTIAQNYPSKFSIL